MRHDTWVEDTTLEDWVCRWTCSCGQHGEWTNTKNRDLVQEQKLEHMADGAGQ